MKNSTKRFPAKKSLGQHFLVDAKAIDTILDQVAEGSPAILEIGTGRGALTEKLARKTEKFFFIEKDETLASKLVQDLQEKKIVPKKFWLADVLEFSFSELWESIDQDTPLTVVSNLPYNIATEIVFKLLENHNRIPKMILMFQKEVGERIMAKPNTKAYGTISVPIQNIYDVDKVQILKPGAFKPAPKVDSIVLSFSRRPKPILTIPKTDLPAFQNFVRKLFSYRRKTLENSLKISGNGSILEIRKILSRIGIDGARRAETLQIEEFGKLFIEVFSERKG